MDRGRDVHSGAPAPANEWLLMDGRGGFAAGPPSGIPERPDHVWLAAAGSHGRLTALLLRCDERVTAGGATFDLAGSFVASDGVVLRSRAAQTALEHLEAFRCDPWPAWRYRVGDVVIERAIRVIEGHPAVTISWRLLEGGAAKLAIAPLLVARDPRALQQESAEFRGAAQGIPGRVRCETLPGRPGLTFWHNGAFLPAKTWQRGLAYPADADDDAPGEPPPAVLVEAAFVPGVVHGTLTPAAGLHLVASTEEQLFRTLAAEERLGTPPARTLAECVGALDAERGAGRAARRARWLARAGETAREAAAAHAKRDAAETSPTLALEPGDAWVAPLAERVIAALVPRGGRVGALVDSRGRPERGDDALRAVPALVALRQPGLALEIVTGALDYLDEGLAPERFDLDDGTPHYGDPAPSLWLVHAIELLVRRMGDQTFLHERAWPAIDGLLHHLRSGSRHGVHCDRDGILWAGEGAASAARADVNALWYHALVAAAQMARQAGHRENAAFSLAWAHELQQVYAARFRDERTGGLFVALTEAGPVRGAEPSQLLAASLAPALLGPDDALRLLASIDAEFRVGEDAATRPWLGVWIAATMRAGARGDDARRRVRERLEALERAGGAERLAADADGAIAAAELLRAWIEDVEHAARPAAGAHATTAE